MHFRCLLFAIVINMIGEAQVGGDSAFSCFEELTVPSYTDVARRGFPGSATVVFGEARGKVQQTVVSAFPNLKEALEKQGLIGRLRSPYCRLPFNIVVDFVMKGEPVNSPNTSVRLQHPNRIILTTQPFRGFVEERTLKPSLTKKP